MGRTPGSAAAGGDFSEVNMAMRMATVVKVAMGFVATAALAGAQMPMAKGKAPLSPPAEAHTMLAGKSVTIHYSQPSMRGRVIMGGLVPYGKVWRTGANEATSLTTDTALRLGTLDLPAGSYTLYTLPAAPGTPWMLIVSRQTGQWGTVYTPSMDLGRTPMTGKKIQPPQQLMTISFEDVSGKHAELHIRWADADESVPVEAR